MNIVSQRNSMSGGQTSGTPTAIVVSLLAMALLLAQSLLLYGHTGRDDAFFTYWPAVTLAEHGEILNYNGERVEQSSTLLHTLCLAALHAVWPAFSLSTLAWALSLAAGALTLCVCAMMLHTHRAPAIAVLALALTPSLVFWSSSGMETTSSTLLFTALLLLLHSPNKHNSHKNSGLIALCASLAALNRPEAFAVLLSFGALGLLLQWLLKNAALYRRWLVLLLSTLITFALVTGWRYYYFGELFPQPVSAKHWPDRLANLLRGLNYLRSGGQSSVTQAITAAGLASFLLAIFWKTHPQRSAILGCGALAIAQMAFILGTGGDWMEAVRFLLPALPALWLAAVLFVSRWRVLPWLLTAAMLALAGWDGWQFVTTKSTGLAVHERAAVQQQYLAGQSVADYSAAELQTKDALRDIPQLEHLRNLVRTIKTPGQQLGIASIQMGFIPYQLSREFFPQLHFLDLRALSTRDITHCPLTSSIYRHDQGVKISYEQFFELLPQLTAQCGIKKPDIFYDLGYDMRKDVLARNGYVITYRERRGIQGIFSRRGIGSELFVAVRRELAEQFSLTDSDGKIYGAHNKAITRPNIVLLLADDISYDHFGFMGNAAARTPTLDQLARAGTVFTSAYVPTAFCRPSLATLLTGQWPHQTRLHANNGVVALPPGTVTLASRLQQQGYATFAGGKFWEDDTSQLGFDAADTDRNHFAREGQEKLWQFIDEQAGNKPLFIWWAPMLPHTPHNPPPALLNSIKPQEIDIPATFTAAQTAEYRGKTQNLLAMNLWMDREIGELQKKLAEKQQLGNTLFVFLSDNGFSHRGISKSSPYELGLRTPIIFHWPNHIPVQHIEAPTQTVNVFNTVLDFAGAAQPAHSAQQPGLSLRPVIEQQKAPRTEIIIGGDYRAVTKKIGPDPRPERDIFALHVRAGAWKYMLYLDELRSEDNANLTIKFGMAPFPTRNPGDEELYNLDADPYEQHNLVTRPEQQQRMRELRRQALQWWQDSGGKPFDIAALCPAEPATLCRKLQEQP